MDSKSGQKDPSITSTEQISLPISPVFAIHFLSGPLKGQKHFLGHELLLGRERGDILIPHKSISSLHCSLQCKDNVTTVKDLGSSNGVLLGGVAIPTGKKVFVKENEILKIGDIEFCIVMKSSNDSDLLVERHISNEGVVAKSSRVWREVELFSKNFIRKIKGFFKRKSSGLKNTSEENAVITEDSLLPDIPRDSTETREISISQAPKEFRPSELNFSTEDESLTHKTLIELDPEARDMDEEQSKEDILDAEKDLKLDLSGEQSRQKTFLKKFQDLTSRGLRLESTPGEIATEEQVKQTILRSSNGRVLEAKAISLGKRKKARKIASRNIPDGAFALWRILSNFVDILFAYLLLTYLRKNFDFFHPNSLIELSKPFIDFLVSILTPFMNNMFSQTIIIRLQKSFYDLMPFLFFVVFFQAFSSLLFGATWGQFLMGLGSHRGFLSNRLAAIIRAPLGFLLSPWIIFDLPCLFNRRTFKEVITLSSISVRRPVFRYLTPCLFLPTILLGLFAFYYLKIGLHQKEFLSAFVELPPVSKPIINYSELVTNASWKLSLPLKKELTYLVYPSYRMEKLGNKKALISELAFQHQEKDLFVTLRTLKKTSLTQAMKNFTMTNPLFEEQYPLLAKIIKEGRDPEVKALEEFKTFLRHAFELDLKTLPSYILDHGPFLETFSRSRKELLDNLKITKIPHYTFSESKLGPSLILLTGLDTPTSPKEIFFIPLNSKIPHNFHLTFSTKFSKQEAIDFFTEVILASELLTNSPKEVIHSTSHFYKTLGLFLNQKELNSDIQNSMEILYNTFFELGKSAIKDDMQAFKYIYINELGNLHEVTKARYGKKADNFLLNILKLKEQVTINQKDFFIREEANEQ